MSFIELEADKALFNNAFVRGEDQGRRRISSAMSRLDKSWDSLTRTTASVFCVMTAATKPECRQYARDLAAGMVGMMSLMSRAWCTKFGSITCEAPDNDVLISEAHEVDALGKTLFDNVDKFGETIMRELLADLPKSWTAHFKLMAEGVVAMQKELSEDDVAFLSRMVTAEQQELTEKFVSAMIGFVEEGSPQVDRLGKWVDDARAMFVSLCRDDDGIYAAMRAVICKFGFPDVCKGV